MTKLSSQEVDQVIDQIGDMDRDQLDRVVDYIREVYKLRRHQENIKVRAQLSVDTRVRLVGNRKPQYLTGLTGTITEMKNSRVVVKLDCGPIGKFRSGSVITAPAGLAVLS